MELGGVLVANNSSRQNSIVRFDCHLVYAGGWLKGSWGYLNDDKPPWNLPPQTSIAISPACFFDVPEDFEVGEDLQFRVAFVTASGRRFSHRFTMKAPNSNPTLIVGHAARVLSVQPAGAREPRAHDHPTVCPGLPPMFRTGLLLGTVMSILASFAGAGAQAEDEQTTVAAQKHTLQYKLKEGETLYWQVSHRARIRSTAGGSTQTVETASDSTKVWRVESVDANGQITLVHQVDHVHMRHSTAGREETAVEIPSPTAKSRRWATSKCPRTSACRSRGW